MTAVSATSKRKVSAQDLAGQFFKGKGLSNNNDDRTMGAAPKQKAESPKIEGMKHMNAGFNSVRPG